MGAPEVRNQVVDSELLQGAVECLRDWHRPVLAKAVKDAIAALEGRGRYWRCGAGHIIEINPGTPPYEMGLCPICAALEDRDRLRAGLIKCRDALRTCAEGRQAIDWFAALEGRDA